LIAAAITIVVGAPGWLEAILVTFLLVTGLWSLFEARKRRRSRE
jgi:hypothetical protein